MTTFDERENAFEEKYAHDEELKFRAKVRRGRLLGLWAAEKLGKTGAAAEQYATSLAAAEVRKDGAGLILKTLRSDFDLAKVPIAEREILKKMDELLAVAVREVTKGKF